MTHEISAKDVKRGHEQKKRNVGGIKKGMNRKKKTLA